MLKISKLKDRIASRAYREFISNCRCARCGSTRGCDPAHVISRKRADGSDLQCIPLCRVCHRLFDDAGKLKIEWLINQGIYVYTLMEKLQAEFRKLKGLPEGDFTEVLRSAGMIEPPFTRRKNR